MQPNEPAEPWIDLVTLKLDVKMNFPLGRREGDPSSWHNTLGALIINGQYKYAGSC